MAKRRNKSKSKGSNQSRKSRMDSASKASREELVEYRKQLEYGAQNRLMSEDVESEKQSLRAHGWFNRLRLEEENRATKRPIIKEKYEKNERLLEEKLQAAKIEEMKKELLMRSQQLSLLKATHIKEKARLDAEIKFNFSIKVYVGVAVMLSILIGVYAFVPRFLSFFDAYPSPITILIPEILVVLYLLWGLGKKLFIEGDKK